jgi:hypothetical protein
VEFEDFVARYFLLVFVVFWCAISFVISLLGGWWFLASAYRAKSDFIGERWWFRSAGFGLANYENVLIVGANQAGLHLACIVPFRVGHPPLFIPWSELEMKHERFFLFRVVTLRANACPRVAIRFRSKFFAKVEEVIRGGQAKPLVV